jgi:transcriptional regulator with XRE-family HTH domain
MASSGKVSWVSPVSFSAPVPPITSGGGSTGVMLVAYREPVGASAPRLAADSMRSRMPVKSARNSASGSAQVSRAPAGIRVAALVWRSGTRCPQILVAVWRPLGTVMNLDLLTDDRRQGTWTGSLPLGRAWSRPQGREWPGDVRGLLGASRQPAESADQPECPGQPAPPGQGAGRADSGPGIPGPPASGRAFRVHNGRVIEADRQPGILARLLGSMLQTAREIAGLSYDQVAARLGCDADWVIRVETGFATAPPEQVARILAEYGVREAAAADTMIDLARRAATPPPWLARHTSRMSAAARDVLLAEAEATLAQVHGVRLIPHLAQTEGYFRDTAPRLFPGCDADQEWDLLAHRQAHRPAGVTRLLEVIIDESALELRLSRPAIMAGQIGHLLALTASPHATVRVIPKDAAFWESRGHPFDILSFAGTTDRISVRYLPFIGAEFASADLHDLWTHIETTSAASLTHSRAILERHLAALS